MAAEAAVEHAGQTAGEYILHHLTFWQNHPPRAVADFTVFNFDSIFYGVLLGVLGCLFMWSAAVGFLLWEMVKLGLTFAMLSAAPRLVAGLSWPALLVGLVLAMKVYWVALAFKPRPRRTGS